MAVRLVVTGKRRHVGWSVLAAVARYESNFGARAGMIAARRLSSTQLTQYGHDENRDGRISMSSPSDALATLAAYLHAEGATPDPAKRHGTRTALTAYFGSSKVAMRVNALAGFYAAVGNGGMQNGLRWETALLRSRVVHDHRVKLTPSGRSDITHGRVDTRVLMTIEYLANVMGRVRVSSLVSGQALFSSSGAVSAHVYGRAVDISAIGGVKIEGHQGPGSVTEQAVRYLLMLPKSLRPRQIISLMDVDGPTGNTGSFALPDHANHISIDY
jgi:hypothetical protein